MRRIEMPIRAGVPMACSDMGNCDRYFALQVFNPGFSERCEGTIREPRKMILKRRNIADHLRTSPMVMRHGGVDALITTIGDAARLTVESDACGRPIFVRTGYSSSAAGALD